MNVEYFRRGLAEWELMFFIFTTLGCFGKRYLLKLKQLNRKRPTFNCLFTCPILSFVPITSSWPIHSLIKFDLNEPSSTINPNCNRNKFIFTFMSAKIYINFRFGSELMMVGTKNIWILWWIYAVLVWNPFACYIVVMHLVKKVGVRT